MWSLFACALCPTDASGVRTVALPHPFVGAPVSSALCCLPGFLLFC